MLTCPLSGAELVGDFAPLEVGNVWVYRYSFHFDNWLSDISSVISLEITAVVPSDDTLLYFFTNTTEGINIRGKVLYDTLPDGTVNYSNPDTLFDTTPISSINQDTLFEYAQTDEILTFWGRGWSVPVMPVWNRHFVDTAIDISQLPYSSISFRDNNGICEINWVRRLIGSINHSEKTYTFQQNIGLMTDYNDSYDHLSGHTLDTTSLLSFTTNQRNNSVHHLHCNPLKTSSFYHPVTNLSLPHISISTRENVFDLMGRSFPAPTLPEGTIKNRQRTYGNRQRW